LETHNFQNTAETYLGQQIEDSFNRQLPGTSGFITLLDGIKSLAARLVMAERAEVSIDAQYYLLKPGMVGYAFLDSLLEAADRGVRVRLLVDDMFTKGYDANMSAVNSHPNFEIGIFNPFANRPARILDILTSFTRINRRMHNKSFTVDNQATVVRGRNIADEYFGARIDAKFGDIDVLGIGPVVQDVSDMFDSYWNHKRAVPIWSFANISDDPALELQQVRNEVEEIRLQVLNSEYAEAVRDEILEYIETDSSVFEWAPYTLAVDSPD